MNLLLSPSRRRGISYLAILIPVAVLGVVLGAALKLTGTQNYSSQRSQAWNMSLVIAECGVEEALAHLNNGWTTNFAANGWTQNGTIYTKRTYITSDVFYDVTINTSNILYPVVTAKGYVPHVVNYQK